MPLLSEAQQVESIKGIIFKKGMLEKLGTVSVTNLKTKIVAYSNLYGEFTAKVSIGDTLLIEKQGFTSIKQPVTSYSTLYITMLPEINLNQVTIKGQTKKQELAEVMDTYRSKGIYYDGHPPILAYIFEPLTTLHELFGKTANQEKHFAEVAKTELQLNEVDRRYTPMLVSKVTGLTGDELKKFMNNFTPPYDDLVKWNDYDLIQYIKRSYAGYKKLGNRQQSAAEVFKASNP
jgi:hypothetical protein